MVYEKITTYLGSIYARISSSKKNTLSNHFRPFSSIAHIAHLALFLDPMTPSGALGFPHGGKTVGVLRTVAWRRWRRRRPLGLSGRSLPVIHFQVLLLIVQKSQGQPPGIYEHLVNTGILTISAGAGFLPSTVCHPKIQGETATRTPYFWLALFPPSPLLIV